MTGDAVGLIKGGMRGYGVVQEGETDDEYLDEFVDEQASLELEAGGVEGPA